MDYHFLHFQTMKMEHSRFKVNQMMMVLQPEVFWRDSLTASCSPPLFLHLGLRQPAVRHLSVWLEGEPGQKRLWRRVWEPSQQHSGPAEPASQQQGLRLCRLRCHSDDTPGDRGGPAAWWVPLRKTGHVNNGKRSQGRLRARTGEGDGKAWLRVQEAEYRAPVDGWDIWSL